MRRTKIAVIYHSQAAGNTRAAAECVAEGVRGAGELEVVLANTNDERVDPVVLAECAGVAIGTPDYFSYPAGGLKVFMDDWLLAKRAGHEDIEGIPVALFLTHGGAAQGPFQDLFKRLGPQVGETVSMKNAPGEADAKACRELGALLARKAQEFLASEG